jgi:hypothetical protein
MEFTDTEKSLPRLSINTIGPLDEDQAIQLYIPAEDATDEIGSPLSTPSPPSNPDSSHTGSPIYSSFSSLPSLPPQGRLSPTPHQTCRSSPHPQSDSDSDHTTFLHEVKNRIEAINLDNLPDSQDPLVCTFFSTRSTILIILDRCLRVSMFGPL